MDPEGSGTSSVTETAVNPTPQPVVVAQPPPSNPNDWKEFTDKNTGRVYYYNATTKQSSWTRPPGFLTPQEKLQPVSSQKIEGTPWTVIKTRGGQSYYNNQQTGETVWTLPPDVVLPTKPEPTPAPEDKMEQDENALKRKHEGTEEPANKKQKVAGEYDPSEGTEEIKMQIEPNETKTEPKPEPTPEPEKRRRIEHEADPVKKEILKIIEANKKKKELDDAKHNPTEASEEYEQKLKAFKDLLNEKSNQIPQFSPFRENIPLLVADPRYKALPSDTERKGTFESWMRTRVTDSKKSMVSERKALKLRNEQAFREMLEELTDKITHETTYENLRELCKDDPRFTAIDSKSEKNLLLAEKILPLREAHHKKKANAEEEFTNLLRTITKIDPLSRWDKIKRLTEVHDDPRYHRDLLNSKEREKYFENYLKLFKKEEEAKKYKRTREELIRKEREKEVRAQREIDEGKMAQEREKLRYNEERKLFSALLAEHVSSTKYSWNEIKQKISYDQRSKTEFLTERDKERLFFERLQSMQGSREREFLQFIQDHPAINAGSTWESSKNLFRDDPRFTGFDRDRSKQNLFEDHVAKLKADATARFIDMLWGFNKIKVGLQVGSKDYLTIKAMLKDDQGWKGLDYLPEHREKVLEEHVKNVNEGAERPTNPNAPQLGDWVVNLREQDNHGHGGRGGDRGDRDRDQRGYGGDRDRPYHGGDRDRPYHGGDRGDRGYGGGDRGYGGDRDRSYHGDRDPGFRGGRGGGRGGFQRPRDPRADVRIETKVIQREKPQAPAGTETRGFERR